jgi:hypothetical protein
MADKEGKLSDRPKRIRAEIFPYYEPKPGIIKILDELNKKNFIENIASATFPSFICCRSPSSIELLRSSSTLS